MRGGVALGALLTALALPAAGLALYLGSGSVAPPPTARAFEVVAPPDRILLSASDAKTAVAVGLLPKNAQSILNIPRRMRYGEFVWNDRDIPDGPVAVVVDLRTQLISVFREGHEIGSAVILYGGDGHDTPLGTHPVKAKARDHRSMTYDAPMPFSLWLTDDGVAVHGSDVRWGAATHGCIGVPVQFAEHLFEAVRVGDRVTIVRSPERGRPTEKA